MGSGTTDNQPGDEADFEGFLESAPFGVYRSSVDGHFLRVNNALVQMLGYRTKAEVLALDLARDVYVDPDERATRIRRHHHERQVTGVDIEWKHRDGHHIQVRISGRSLRDAEGSLTGFEMIAEDITQRIALEHAVQQAQRLETVGRLTAGIAHDFNNLLTVIQTHATLLASGLPPDLIELRQEVDGLTAAARRGAFLVGKLLTFTRRDPPKFEYVDLAAWMADTAGTVRRLLPSNIEIALRAEGATGTVRADPGALEQIVMNLATNARDAMPEGGTLDIEVSRTLLTEADRPLHSWVEPGAYMCLAVSDNGTGMDATTQKHLFEALFTTKPRGEGTGLGMAVVYGLVKAMRGYVHVYSELNHGTTIKVYLRRDRARASDATPVVTQALTSGRPVTILLVDDDASLRSVAARLFEHLGHTVILASNGVEALQLFRARAATIAAAVTDLMMPQMDGANLYQALRAEAPDLRILLMSGYAAPAIRSQLSADPLAGFVTKPWTAAELVGEFNRLLAV